MPDITVPPDTFGAHLRRERERLGLSLERAAVKIGLSKSRLRELETGFSLKTRKPTRPTFENVEAIACGLALDQNHLAALAGLGYRLDPTSQQESQLLAAFRALPSSHKAIALRLLDALRDTPSALGDVERWRAAESSGGRPVN